VARTVDFTRAPSVVPITKVFYALFPDDGLASYLKHTMKSVSY